MSHTALLPLSYSMVLWFTDIGYRMCCMSNRGLGVGSRGTIHSEDYNFEELSCQFVRPTLSLVGHENKNSLTSLHCYLPVWKF